MKIAVHSVDLFLLEPLQGDPVMMYACNRCYRKWRVLGPSEFGFALRVHEVGDGTCDREAQERPAP